MPVVNISMIEGKSDAYRGAIMDGIYNALRDALSVPEHDHFMTITEHSRANFRYGPAFGIEYSDDLIFIAITLFDTRPIDHKERLYKSVVAHLQREPGVRPEDVFINLYGTPKENWSVGNGDMQFGPGRVSHG